MNHKEFLTSEDFASLGSRADLLDKLDEKNIDISTILDKIKYEEELKSLQIELVKLQQWIKKSNKRVAVIFEGRDAAGKGGAIRRFMEHLNPRSTRLVALNKPTDIEMGQWYFMRYIKELPNPGEIVFFDRSWYNRAVVEPVMGFCSDDQYDKFMAQVPEFEHMLYEDGLIIIKFWLSISKNEQMTRFD
ncbi:MAG: polyphosphate kinase 2, partial [Wenyingzhuangia sp.]